MINNKQASNIYEENGKEACYIFKMCSLKSRIFFKKVYSTKNVFYKDLNLKFLSLLGNKLVMQAYNI